MTKYNGWTNYETWLVASQMDENQNYFNEMVKQLYNGENNIIKIANKFRDYFEENNPFRNEIGIYADLIKSAISEVNWYEIAEHYIKET